MNQFKVGDQVETAIKVMKSWPNIGEVGKIEVKHKAPKLDYRDQV